MGRFSFALLRCKPPSPIRETGQDHCHTGPWSHREGSNLQPTDYKTVALQVELRWHIPPPLLSPRRNAAVNTAAGVVFFPLRLSRPSLGGDIMISHSQGSFQRDSAFLTLKGCHYTRSRPAMATGRPLVISLARYATPIRQYSVSPQSFAAWRARPSAQFMGWFSAVQRRGPILPPRCRAVEKEAQRYTPPRLHPTSSVWLLWLNFRSDCCT